MAKNPIGPDGAPMERHHSGRLAGNTEMISRTEHDLIHQNERDAVKEIFKKEGIDKGHSGKWTGKNISKE